MNRIIVCFITLISIWGCTQNGSNAVTGTTSKVSQFEALEIVRGTASSYQGETLSENPVTVNLKAGQHINAGTVTANNSDTKLFVTVSTTGFGEFTTAHLHIGETLDDFPLNRQGNPKVGHFAYKSAGIPTESVTFVLELSELGTGIEETVLISFHADMMLTMDEEEEVAESAWSEGTTFPGSSWAMYFDYQINEEEPQ